MRSDAFLDTIVRSRSRRIRMERSALVWWEPRTQSPRVAPSPAQWSSKGHLHALENYTPLLDRMTPVLRGMVAIRARAPLAPHLPPPAHLATSAVSLPVIGSDRFRSQRIASGRIDRIGSHLTASDRRWHHITSDCIR